MGRRFRLRVHSPGEARGMPTISDAMVDQLSRETGMYLGELGDEPRSNSGYYLPQPPSGLRGFAGFDGWDGNSRLMLGYDGLPGYNGLGTPGWLRRMRERRANRRKKRKEKMKRIRARMKAYRKRARRRRRERMHAFCQKHRKFCNFWERNWAKIARILNTIGGILASMIPYVGAILGPAMAASTEALIRAGEATQKCMKGKGKGCWKKGLKEWGLGMAEGALDTACNLGGKFGGKVGLTSAMQKKLDDIMSSPEAKKLIDLYRQVEKKTGSAKDAILDEIDKLDDVLEPKLQDLEEELDEIYWEKAGWNAEWEDGPMAVREDKSGDFWGFWDPENEEDPPEGVVPGIWYRLSGDSAISAAEKKMGDLDVAQRSGAGDIAAESQRRELHSAKPAWMTAQDLSKNAKSPPPKMFTPVKIGEAEREGILSKMTPEQRERVGVTPLWRAGNAVVLADSMDEARAKLVQAAAGGKMGANTASGLGFTAKGPEWLIPLGIGVGIVAAVAIATRKR